MQVQLHNFLFIFNWELFVSLIWLSLHLCVCLLSYQRVYFREEKSRMGPRFKIKRGPPAADNIDTLDNAAERYAKSCWDFSVVSEGLVERQEEHVRAEVAVHSLNSHPLSRRCRSSVLHISQHGRHSSYRGRERECKYILCHQNQ